MENTALAAEATLQLRVPHLRHVSQAIQNKRGLSSPRSLTIDRDVRVQARARGVPPQATRGRPTLLDYEMAEAHDEPTTSLQNGHEAPQDMADTTLRDRGSSGASSDSDGGERPVRRKLKKTSIAGLSSRAQESPDKRPHPLQETTSSESAPLHTSDQQPTSLRGRPARKRSFDDLQNDESVAISQAEADDPPHAKNGHHKRMRSRDLSSSEHVSLPGKSDNGITTPLEEEEESDMDAQKSPGGPGVLVDSTIDENVTKDPEDSTDPQDMIRPKKKRSRDQSDKEDNSALDTSELQPPSSSQKEAEPDKKRHREEEQATSAGLDEPSRTSTPPSGFANASTASPFGSFTSPKKSALSSVSRPADASAFKSSGLSAFASSEKSPFGAVGSASTGFGGTTNSGGFASASTKVGFGAASNTSAFGNVPTASPFGGTSTTGFGGLGSLQPSSGFGSLGSFGGGLRGDLGTPSTTLGGGGSGSNFAGPPSSQNTFGLPSTTKQKAFGAPEGDDDSGSGSDSGSQNDEDGEPEETVIREARLKEQIDRECPNLFSCPNSANTADQVKLVKRKKKFSSNVERNYTTSRIKSGKSEVWAT